MSWRMRPVQFKAPENVVEDASCAPDGKALFLRRLRKPLCVRSLVMLATEPPQGAIMQGGEFVWVQNTCLWAREGCERHPSAKALEYLPLDACIWCLPMHSVASLFSTVQLMLLVLFSYCCSYDSAVQVGYSRYDTHDHWFCCKARRGSSRSTSRCESRSFTCSKWRNSTVCKCFCLNIFWFLSHLLVAASYC